jgi:RNA polymerase sigma-70 factor (ECF subfamily)
MLLNNVRNFTRHYRTGKRALGREVVYGPDDSSNAPLGAGALADSILTPSSKAIEREQAAALQRAIDQLPEDYRRVILLRFSEGKSFEEIGDGMKRSPDAVRKLWARAVERLLQDFEGLP